MKTALTKYEKKNYVMKESKDWIILEKIKKLEKNNLSSNDKGVIKLIRTQLKDDWRTPLINFLNKIQARYRK